MARQPDSPRRQPLLRLDCASAARQSCRSPPQPWRSALGRLREIGDRPRPASIPSKLTVGKFAWIARRPSRRPRKHRHRPIPGFGPPRYPLTDRRPRLVVGADFAHEQRAPVGRHRADPAAPWTAAQRCSSASGHAGERCAVPARARRVSPRREVHHRHDCRWVAQGVSQPGAEAAPNPLSSTFPAPGTKTAPESAVSL